MAVVSPDRVPGGLTPEERFARKVITTIGHPQFSTELLIQTLVVYGGLTMQGTLMRFAMGIIYRYSDMHDCGLRSKHTKLAHQIAKSMPKR